MKNVKFICKDCRYKFDAVIYERGEAEEKRMRTSPVVCKRCGSPNVERR